MRNEVNDKAPKGLGNVILAQSQPSVYNQPIMTKLYSFLTT